MTTDEKIDLLLDRTARIEQDIKSSAESARIENHNTHQRLHALEKWRLGNGTPGIDVRVDRLDGFMRGTKKLMWMLVGVGVTVVGGGAIAFVVKGGLSGLTAS